MKNLILILSISILSIKSSHCQDNSKIEKIRDGVILNRTLNFGLSNENRYLKLMYDQNSEYINNITSTFNISENIGIIDGEYKISKEPPKNYSKDYSSLQELYIFIFQPKLTLEVKPCSSFYDLDSFRF